MYIKGRNTGEDVIPNGCKVDSVTPEHFTNGVMIEIGELLARLRQLRAESAIKNLFTTELIEVAVVFRD